MECGAVVFAFFGFTVAWLIFWMTASSFSTGSTGFALELFSWSVAGCDMVPCPALQVGAEAAAYQVEPQRALTFLEPAHALTSRYLCFHPNLSGGFRWPRRVLPHQFGAGFLCQLAGVDDYWAF